MNGLHTIHHDVAYESYSYTCSVFARASGAVLFDVPNDSRSAPICIGSKEKWSDHVKTNCT